MVFRVYLRSTRKAVILLAVIVFICLNIIYNSLFTGIIAHTKSTRKKDGNRIGNGGPTSLPVCTEFNPNRDPLLITFEKPTIIEIEAKFPGLKLGGVWRPESCQSREPLTAIIVPYRDRQDHLRIFLNLIHGFLQSQNLSYAIYIVEQGPGAQFNRGMLLNIGFTESRLDRFPGCVVFHDVDLLPEDNRNQYTCKPGTALHLSAHVDELNYKLPYDGIVGGALSFWADDFLSINGFSNKFWGWGGEDDDLFYRMRHHGLNISRYNQDVSRYKMIRHRKTHPNRERFKYLQSSDRRFYTDGLNTLKYTKLQMKKHKLYTWLYVQVNETNWG